MIKIPYKVTSDIQKYEGPAFNPKPNSYYIFQKIFEIEKMGSQLGYTLLDGFQFVKDLSRYCGFEETKDIRDIASQLEEDVAILYNGKIVSMCFCFPSGFNPSEKVALSFAEMHAPVADAETLIKMSDKITTLISKPNALYRRYVWTLTTTPNLSRHPVYKHLEPPVTTIDKLYFRNETQTTVGYGDGRTTFFFVKVEVTPFNKLSLEMQQQAIDSLNTMSDAVLQYKGLSEIKKLFNA